MSGYTRGIPRGMSGILPGECLEMACRDGTESTTQDELLNAWRKKDFKAFEEVLSRDDCDPNFMYSKENYKRLLEVASEEGAIEYVKALIKAGADMNLVNATRSKAPIHFAVESENFEIMKLLVENGADVNIRDGTGSTILHYIMRQKWEPEEVRYPECLRYLLEQEDLDPNLTNRKGFTPIHLAAIQGSYQSIKMLLDKGINLDLDSNKVGIAKKTAREAILEKYPDLESELPIPEKYYEIKMDGDKLFSLLHNRFEDRFCKKFGQEVKDRLQKSLLTYTDGRHTFLQYCCQNGLAKAVKVLLEHQVDVNYAPHQTKRPVFLACMKGNHEILRSLLNANPDLSPNEDGENVLHVVVKYTDGSEDHLECLRILLRRLKETNLDINAQDLKGNTPLHYAVKYGGKKCTDELLANGAYIGTLNKSEEPPLAHMSASVLGNYLDSCITSTDSVDHESNYFLTFNYNFLIPKRKKKEMEAEDVKISLTADCEYDREPAMSESETSTPECEPLLYMSRNSHLRKLLVHPVLTSFIMLKWQRVRIFYYVNLLVYFLFCLLLLIYILFGYRYSKPDTVANYTSVQGEIVHYTDAEWALNPSHTAYQGGSQELQTNHTYQLNSGQTHPQDMKDAAVDFVRTLLLIFLVILALREVFQVTMNPKKYFCDLENWLEIVLLVVLAFVVIKDCSREFSHSDPLHHVCPQFCAIAVLLALFELVLLVGKHPLQSLHIEMFKTVSTNFLKFLAWYIILIIAFALTFYILFRACGDECDDNPFTTPGLSVFKTVVMLTGEFEAGDIPFVVYVGTSHLIFIAFVFLIAIVLINLLNGLAVTDTQMIRDDAYLYRCIALVKLISYIENMLLINSGTFSLPCLKWCNSDNRKKESCNINCFDYLAKRIVFFPNLLPEGVIYILPNQRYRICFSVPKSVLEKEPQDCCTRLNDYYTDPITAKKAELILAQRQMQESNKAEELKSLQLEVKSCTEDLASMRKNLENLEQLEKQNEQLLIQILAILGFNKANNDERY